MTVGTKLHQTLVSCESAVANLKSFALDTENQQAKSLYANLAQTLEQSVVQQLREQVNLAEQEEPQYKVFNQAQQQQSSRQQSQQQVQPEQSYTS